MKKLAARNYEDILQVSSDLGCHKDHLNTFHHSPQNMIPAVEGLLPEPHNTHLLRLLYRLAEWHALAKLRMHTEHTLRALERATKAIGKELRFFREWTRTAFTVNELPREIMTRERRRQRKQAQPRPGKRLPEQGSFSAKKGSAPQSGISANLSGSIPQLDTSVGLKESASGPGALTDQPKKKPLKVKILNLNTYKVHALEDYVHAI
jgi:hypothetical protein